MDRKYSIIVVVTIAVALVLGGLFTSIISNLNALDAKVQDLQWQINSKTMQPYLVTSLWTYDVNASDLGFSFLAITGTVKNEGLSTAYNAGLWVVAWDSANNTIINMTTPIGIGSYGSGAPNQGPSTLNTIVRADTVETNLRIYYQGAIANWTIKPIFTNQP